MPSKALQFSSSGLLDCLRIFPTASRYLVGFSGGADSTALLLALFRQRQNLDSEIQACHFNHGLHPESDTWQKHCEDFCAQRDIALICSNLELDPNQPNLENTARDLRYNWVAGRIDTETAYLTAHHADDRAETFLLNALRGSGLDGVSGIPDTRALGAGRVIRPLLSFSRASLVAYLVQHEICWIEDPGNQDSGPDRNFIRNQVFPLLEQRWPATRYTLARTSSHLRSTNEILKQGLGYACNLTAHENFRLPLNVLNTLGENASSLVLREWLHRHSAPSVPENRIREFLYQTINAASDSKCELRWEGWKLRLYRSVLYLSEPGELSPCPDLKVHSESVVNLGKELGVIKISENAFSSRTDWSLGPRRPGVRIRLYPGGPGRKLKKIFQEQLIPPWQRMSIPILYQGDEVLAIGDWQFAPEFRQWLDDHSLKYEWLPGQAELRDTQIRCRDLARKRGLA